VLAEQAGGAKAQFIERETHKMQTIQTKQGTRRLLSFLLVLALTVSMTAAFGVTASAATLTPYSGQTAPGDYSINSAAQLTLLSTTINSMTDQSPGVTVITVTLPDGTTITVVVSKMNITLLNDISLTGAWTPIGNVTVGSASTSSPIITGGTAFGGTFDGDGFTISGVDVNASTDAAGLFSFLPPKAVIQDLTVTGTVDVDGGEDAIGGVVGYNSGIINKVNNGVVVTAGSAYNVGGIAGFNDGYYFNGVNSADATDKYVAQGVIVNCENNGAVTGMNKVGGITGENAGKISSCANYAKVDGTNASSKNGVGGIAGRAGNNNTAYERSLIIDCLNAGEVGRSGQKWVGGMTGFASANSYIANSLSVGFIVRGAGNDNPIAGQQEGTVDTTSVYCDAALNYTSSATSIPERGIPKALTDIQTLSFAQDLDGGSTGTGIWAGANGETPHLTYTAQIPNPGGGGSNNTLAVVYLDNANGDDGNNGSTQALAVKTLGEAVAIADASSVSGVYVYVMNTINIPAVVNADDAQSVFGDGTSVKWYGTTGPMFNIVANGDLTIGGLNIDGNGVATAFNVVGDLTVRNNASVTNCGIAIDVQSGGDLRLNRSTIGGTTNSVKMESGAGTFTIYTSDTQYVTLNGTVYLATGEYISIGSKLTNMPTAQKITIQCQSPPAAGASDITVAQGSSYTLQSTDAAKVVYVDAVNYSIVFQSSNNRLRLHHV
jgi:hypothetical protein